MQNSTLMQSKATSRNTNKWEC